MAEGAEEQPCARSELHRQQNLSLVSVCLCLVLFAARTSDHFLSVLVAHEAVFFSSPGDVKPGHTPGENTVSSSLVFVVV